MTLREGAASSIEGFPHEYWNDPTDLDEHSLLVLPTCIDTWVFDVTHKRFCRVGVDVAHDSRAGANWQHYERLMLAPHGGAFAVLLDEKGTRLLRARAHRLPCERCGAQSVNAWS